MTGWICARCIRRLRTSTSHRPFSTSRVRRGRGDNDNHTWNVASLLARPADADPVTINGWVRSVRRQKNITFAAIGDGSSLKPVQVVLKPDDAAELSTGAAVSISGVWRPSHGAKQSHELQARDVHVLGDNDPQHNPIQSKYHSPEYLRSVPHLRPRHHVLLPPPGLVQCHTPIITSSDCEGAGEVFTVATSHASTPHHEDHFFRTPKYLTVSAQLHLEALSQALDKVWTLSPTFRAEKSDTPRHLSEFYMLEAEQSFTHSLDDVMNTLESLLHAIATDLHTSPLAHDLLRQTRYHHHHNHHLSSADPTNPLTPADGLAQRWAGLTTPNWPRIPYATALTHLQ
ncbi:asparaginyl-tRNA synthetase, partial [Teratosphaeria destructans]